MKIISLILAIFGFSLIFYLWGGFGNKTPHNYFVYFANRILQGKIDISNTPAQLNELIPWKGKNYMVYPPLPGIILVPIVALFGLETDQTLISQMIGSLNTVMIFGLALKMGASYKKSLWLTAFFGLGTIYWFLATVGSVWYLAHVLSATFLIIALLTHYLGKDSFWMGLCVGASFWCRLPTVLSVLFFVTLIWSARKNQIDIIKFLIGLGIFIFVYWGYNYIRFGSIWETGYSLIPGVLREPWYRYGVFSWRYIADNAQTLFFKLPIADHRFLFLVPSWSGLSILITSPTFLYLFKNNFSKPTNLSALICIVVIIVFVLAHGANGFSQFGYRFATDAYILMWWLVAGSFIRKFNWIRVLSIVFSIIVNLWGVVFINKLGWVSW